MNESKQNLSSDFLNKEEAFEFLVQESQNKAIKDLWKIELDQLPDAPLERKGIVRHLFIKRAVALAASFIVIVGSFFWFTNQNNSLQHMASAMIEETNFVLQSDSYTRGYNETVNGEFAIELQLEISKALDKQDYKASVGLFLTKEEISGLSLDDKFYYSLSLARSDDGDDLKAIGLLDEVINKKEKYYNEALWLQGLLYLKINEPNKSKYILNKLINNSNYQITNTQAILDRMAN